MIPKPPPPGPHLDEQAFNRGVEDVLTMKPLRQTFQRLWSRKPAQGVSEIPRRYNLERPRDDK